MKTLIIVLAIALATTPTPVYRTHLPIIRTYTNNVILGQAVYYVDRRPVGPAANLSLALGEVNVEVGWARVSQDSPRAVTDMSGAFAFTGIEEGWYALAIDTALGPMPIVDAMDGVCWAFYVNSETYVITRIQYGSFGTQTTAGVDGWSVEIPK